MLDQTDDLGQHGMPADSGCLHGEGTFLIDGAAHQRTAGAFLYRNGLARNHGLVHIASALQHGAVHRHTFAGAHLERVASHHVGQRNVHALAIAYDVRCLGLQPDQPLDGLRSTPFGAGFQKTAQQYQGHNDRCRLIVNIDRASRQQVRQERCHDRVHVRSQSANGHQRVHVWGRTQQGGDALEIKPPARNQQHKGGQNKL